MMSKLSFYKIIRSPSDDKLEIPETFVRLHGENLRSSLRLITRCGSEWKIKLVKKHGRAWLHRGWSDFEKRFRLESGDLLCFRLAGSSTFKVTIFDTSAVEINRPIEITRIPSSGNNSPLSDKEENLERSYQSSVEVGFERLQYMEQRSQQRSRRQVVRGTKAFEEAKLFKPRNPFFTTVIQRNRNYHANVSPEFGNKYFKNENQTVQLKTKDGKSWPVGLRVGRGRTRYYLCDGYYKFVRDNDLHPGDVCVYELVKRSVTTLRVRIFCN